MTAEAEPEQDLNEIALDPNEQQEVYENEIIEKERQYRIHQETVKQNMGGLLSTSKHFGRFQRMPYWCPTCNQHFSKRKQFDKHMDSHQPMKECQHCIFKCRNQKTFESHQLKHVKKVRQFECDMCDSKFTSISFLRSHKGRLHKKFHCAECDFVGNAVEERNDHMVDVHNSKPIGKKYTISVCDEEDDENNTKTGHTCQICQKTCRTQNLLKIHVAQHMGVSPSRLTDDFEICEDTSNGETNTESSGSVSDTESVYNFQSVKRSRAYKLDEVPCKKIKVDPVVASFPLGYADDPEYNLLARIRPSSENAEYYCEKCSIEFIKPHDMFLHTILKHTFVEFDNRQRKQKNEQLKQNNSQRKQKIKEQQPIIEETVNEVATPTIFEASHLPIVKIELPEPEYEIENTQPHVPRKMRKTFDCEDCGERFRKCAQLKRHKRTHRSVRQCSACSFSTKIYLRMKTHQANCHKDLVRCTSFCTLLFKTQEEMLVHKESAHKNRSTKVREEE